MGKQLHLQEANHTECDGLAAHSSNFHTDLSNTGANNKPDYWDYDVVATVTG